jgi:hypothetical protein
MELVPKKKSSLLGSKVAQVEINLLYLDIFKFSLSNLTPAKSKLSRRFEGYCRFQFKGAAVQVLVLNREAQ